MATFDNLDKTFNIVPAEEDNTSVEIISDDIELDIDKRSHLDQDYTHSRDQLYNLMKKGQEAIDGILDVAAQSDHPRAYEVAFQGIKNVSELADKLLDIQKKIKDIEEEKVQRGPSTVNNSVFFGSTADLQKFIKQQKQSEDK